MRIIAGKYKSRIIKTIKSYDTRPVLDRVKESVFNILIHKYLLEEFEVLDLFAGSGSFGLEALSRGAKNVTFIEKAPLTCKIILENIRNLGCESECTVLKRDVKNYIETCSGSYDMIFYDPPFKLAEAKTILDLIYNKGILKEEGILIFRSDYDYNSDSFGFRLIDKRKIGINIVYFLGMK
jgi:16S rRNA (guanine966-N2)-methyltransferase